MAEKDFAVVPCHDSHDEPECAILPACNLKRGMRRAVEAFIAELDKMTLAQTITVPSVAVSLLQIGSGREDVVVRVPPPGSRPRKIASR